MPAEREALEKLPGVGRKTANVVLNMAFGAADDCRRHAHLPDRQPDRTWRRARPPDEVEDRLVPQIIPTEYLRARPSLADPARPLCLHRPQT